MKIIYFTIIILLNVILAKAQLPTFNNALQGTPTANGNNSNVYSLKVNPNTGDTYAIGTFTGTVDFDPSVVTNSLTSNGGTDIFVAKYSSAGALSWVFKIGGANTEQAYDIAISPTLNEFYITGSFKGTVDFDPSGNTTNLVSQSTNANLGDVYLAKYTMTGAFLWAFSVGNTSNVNSYGIQLNVIPNTAENEIYLLGSVSGTVDLDPSAATYNINSGIYNSSFLAKYGSDMQFQWGFTLGKAFFGTFDVDSNGNIIASGFLGYTTTPFDFDPGAGTYNVNFISGYSSNPFIVKYNPDRTVSKAVLSTTTNNFSAKSIKKVGDGTYVFTGRFKGDFDVDFSPTQSSILSSPSTDALVVSRLDNNLNFLWGNKIVSNFNENISTGRCITDTKSSTIAITGCFLGSNDFDPNTAVATGSSASGSYSGFMAGYDFNGLYKFHFVVGNETSGGYSTNGSTNAIDLYQTATKNSLVMGGNFLSRASVNVDFDPSTSATYFLGNTSFTADAAIIASYEIQKSINTYFSSTATMVFAVGSPVPINFNSNFEPQLINPCNYVDDYVFEIELSDATGSFSSPTVVSGEIFTSIVPRSLAALIPSGTPIGSNYRLRVVTRAFRRLTNYCSGLPSSSYFMLNSAINGSPTAAFSITTCPTNLVITGISQAPFQAAEYITTSGTVHYATSNRRLYTAGKAITITPPTGGGYWLSALGTVFEAKIQGCL